MARQCAICGRAPREGEEMRPIRLRTEADLAATEATELGLYSACLECVDDHRQRVMDRDGSNYEAPEVIPNKGLL